MTATGDPYLRSVWRFTVRWWRQPDQFDWLTGYLRARGLGVAMRVLMTMISGALVLISVALVSTPTRSPVVAMIAGVVAAVTGVTYAVLWVRRWPTRFESLSLAVIAGTVVAIDAPLQPDPAIGLLACTSLAIVGGYVAFFHSTRAVLYTVILSAVAGAVCATRMVDTHGVAVAVVVYWLVLELNLAVPLGIQGVVRTLGADVVRSDHDPLTGLLNRRAFYERATTLLTAPFSDMHLLVVMIDLDKFKVLNDSYGHIAGDQALAAVGWALREASAAAIVGRFGGEEFIVIDALPHKTAMALPDQLCRAIAELPQPVTASVGAAVVRWDGVVDPAAAIEALIRAADTAMYTAKRDGGNQTRLCTPALN